MSYQERWEAAAHRTQTTTAFLFGLKYPWMDERLLSALKHIRVGVDTNKADHGSLAGLLIKKGVITKEEYAEAMVDGQEAEAERQQEWLQQAMRSSGGNPDLKVTTG